MRMRLPPADCMVVCDIDRVEEKRAAAQKEFPNPIITLTQVMDWFLEQPGMDGPR